MTHHPLFAMALLLCTLVCGTRAGFDHAAGYDGVPIGRGTDPVAMETFTKLSAIFTNATPVDITNKVAAFRTNILRMIEVIRAQNPPIANCLATQYQQGRICADVQNRQANASIKTDKTTNCAAEPINIGLNNLPCHPVPVYHFGTYQLLSSLIHEGRHAIQQYETNRASLADRVRGRKSTACNEIEAEQTENGIIDNLKPALSNYLAGAAIPNSTTGAAQVIIQALLQDPNLTAAERTNAARALLVNACNIREGNLLHIECRVAQKEAFDRFLTNGITFDDLNDLIRMTAWFAMGRTNGDFGPVTDPIYLGTAQSPFFHQRSGEVEYGFPTPSAGLHDMWRSPDYRRLLLAGDSPGLGGIVLGYEDTDGDGYYEPGTQRILLTGPELGGGLDIEPHPVPGTWLALNRATSQVFRLIDTNADGFPDVAQPAGGFDPSQRGLHSLVVAPDGRRIYGFDEVRQGEEVTPVFETELQVAQQEFPGGPYETLPTEPFIAGAAYGPVLHDGVAAGSVLVRADAPPLTPLQVVVLDPTGLPGEILGGGTVGPDGVLPVPLLRPLAVGEVIAVLDPLRGMRSVPYPVEAILPRPQIVNVQVGPAGVQFVALIFDPFSWSVEVSPDLQTWSVLPGVTLNGPAQTFLDPAPPDGTTRYYRLVRQELP